MDFQESSAGRTLQIPGDDLKRLETFPLSLRLIYELHERLMTGVRGEHQTPGEFRRSQNWIGTPGGLLKDATFVPPPPEAMREALHH
jgi:Fic family protein